MIKIGDRAKTQPPPPPIVFDALVDPDRDPTRPWLELLPDEQRPRILESEPARIVGWSSLFTRRPDAVIRFELLAANSGTRLRWMLFVEEPPPDQSLTGHMCKRINQLINANLRYTFGH
ncbi:MAG: hypothetical protein INR66_24355 [Gordonia polyisoprenivorans]|nr:hypothetical protein [Gordonia polyisoprenivorans]